MSDTLALKSCTDFTRQLASKAPVPGGGGAAALIGSLAASLGSMATNLTIGKKKFAAYEKDHLRIIQESEALRLKFLSLIDEDAENFEPLSRAYSSGDPKLLRNASMQASQAPFEMMSCCCRVIELLEELLPKCSRLLLSDVGCAASAVQAALECASMNVFVNTASLKQDEEALAIHHQAEQMLTDYLPRARFITESIMKEWREHE